MGDPGSVEVAAYAHRKKCHVFVGGGKQHVSEGKNEHQPCHLKRTLEEIPPAIAVKRP